jgi:hypothetical protein
MASEIEIINLALARLGDDATVASISPPEGSAQAEHAQRFYPIARDSMLEMHAWAFACKRVSIALQTVDSWDWDYAYARPADAIRILSILAYGASSDDATENFDLEGDTILTDVELATCRYVARITDSAKFPPLFVDSLAWLLASYLAGPVLKGDSGASMAKSCYQNFRATFSLAASSDANQRKVRPVHTPDWIAGR